MTAPRTESIRSRWCCWMRTCGLMAETAFRSRPEPQGPALHPADLGETGELRRTPEGAWKQGRRNRGDPVSLQDTSEA